MFSLLGKALFFVHCFQKVACLQTNAFDRSTSSSSLLAGTRWKLQLDVGVQPGTWMPKRFPGWGESGARLGLGVEVEFTHVPSKQAESLVGPLTETYQLTVTSPPTKFVSLNGEETVEFTTGGWCIQRPTADVRNSKGGLVKPEGLLRFWLYCASGAKRSDVEIFPGTRIFFTTGVWDDPMAVKDAETKYQETLKEIEVIKERTRENKARSQDQNILEYLGTFGQLVGDSRTFDALNEKRQQFEREMPPPGSTTSPNGVRIAPKGSLVIKGNQTPDWMPGSEYLILGTFACTGICSPN